MANPGMQNGALNKACTTTDSAPELDMVAGQISDATARLTEVVNRLDCLKDRLWSIDGEAKQLDPPCGGGVMGAIGHSLEVQRHVIDDLESLARRLAKL